MRYIPIVVDVIAESKPDVSHLMHIDALGAPFDVDSSWLVSIQGVFCYLAKGLLFL